MTARQIMLAMAAAMAASAVAAAVEAADKVNWNASLWGNRRGFTEGVETLAREVAARTSGNFTIILHYGGAISPPKENLDGIKIGAFELATICTSYHPGKNPVMTGLDLPFLPLPDLDVHREVHEAYYRHPAAVAEMAQWNAVAIFSNLLQQYELLGKGKPPRSLDDFKGMRVRAVGGLGDALKNLGASPAGLPAPEVYTALERGMVDAAAFPFTTAHGAFRLHEVSNWFTANLNPGVGNCPLVVNKDALAGLPAEWRQMIHDLKPAMYDSMRKAYEKGDQKWLPVFRERLEEVIYDPQEIQEFQERAARPIWEAWVEEVTAKGVPGRELLDLILTTAAKTKS